MESNVADEMKDKELRMACLRLAREDGFAPEDEIVRRAKAYYAFANGTEAKVVSDGELFNRIMEAEAKIEHGKVKLGAGVSGNEQLSGNETEPVKQPGEWPSLNRNEMPCTGDEARRPAMPPLPEQTVQGSDYAPDPAAVDDPWAKQQATPEDKETADWWARQIGGGR
jgi:hypothetical protein